MQRIIIIKKTGRRKKRDEVVGIYIIYIYIDGGFAGPLPPIIFENAGQ
jgi:hypothetical protein